MAFSDNIVDDTRASQAGLVNCQSVQGQQLQRTGNEYKFNINEEIAMLPPSKNLFKFYRRKFLEYDKEEEEYRHKLDKYLKICNDRHKLEEEVTRRGEKIGLLQKALSDIQNCLLQEREHVFLIEAERQDLKLKERAHHVKIRHLLEMTKDSKIHDQIVYIFEEPLNLYICQRPVPNNDEEQTHVKQVSGKNIASASFDKHLEIIEILKAEANNIQTQFQKYIELSREKFEVVSQDCHISLQEAEAQSMRDRAQIKSICDKLKETEVQLNAANCDFLEIKRKFRQEENLREMERDLLIRSIRLAVDTVSNTDSVDIVVKKVSDAVDNAVTLMKYMNDENLLKYIENAEWDESTNNGIVSGKQVREARLTDDIQTVSAFKVEKQLQHRPKAPTIVAKSQPKVSVHLSQSHSKHPLSAEQLHSKESLSATHSIPKIPICASQTVPKVPLSATQTIPKVPLSAFQTILKEPTKDKMPLRCQPHKVALKKTSMSSQPHRSGILKNKSDSCQNTSQSLQQSVHEVTQSASSRLQNSHQYQPQVHKATSSEIICPKPDLSTTQGGSHSQESKKQTQSELQRLLRTSLSGLQASPNTSEPDSSISLVDLQGSSSVVYSKPQMHIKTSQPIPQSQSVSRQTLNNARKHSLQEHAITDQMHSESSVQVLQTIPFIPAGNCVSSFSAGKFPVQAMQMYGQYYPKASVSYQSPLPEFQAQQCYEESFDTQQLETEKSQSVPQQLSAAKSVSSYPFELQSMNHLSKDEILCDDKPLKITSLSQMQSSLSIQPDSKTSQNLNSPIRNASQSATEPKLLVNEIFPNFNQLELPKSQSQSHTEKIVKLQSNASHPTSGLQQQSSVKTKQSVSWSVSAHADNPLPQRPVSKSYSDAHQHVKTSKSYALTSLGITQPQSHHLLSENQSHLKGSGNSKHHHAPMLPSQGSFEAQQLLSGSHSYLQKLQSRMSSRPIQEIVSCSQSFTEKIPTQSQSGHNATAVIKSVGDKESGIINTNNTSNIVLSRNIRSEEFKSKSDPCLNQIQTKTTTLTKGTQTNDMFAPKISSSQLPPEVLPSSRQIYPTEPRGINQTHFKDIHQKSHTYFKEPHQISHNPRKELHQKSHSPLKVLHQKSHACPKEPHQISYNYSKEPHQTNRPHSKVIQGVSQPKERLNPLHLVSHKQCDERIESLKEKNKTLSIELQELNNKVKENEEQIKECQSQCIHLESQLSDTRQQRQDTASPYEEQNKALEKQLEKTKARLQRLETYRHLEMEGFQTDIKNLTLKIKNMEKQLMKAVILMEQGDKDMELLKTVHSTTHRSRRVTTEIKRLKAKLYELESDMKNL